MLISIGRRAGAADLTGLLLDCHARIRHFAAVSVRLATDEASAEERAAAASSIARYFGEALPLHVRDEEESLVPRLRACAELDAPLDRMHREHAAHDALLGELVTMAGAIAADPRSFAAHAARLQVVAAPLRDELLAHLEHEERVILPRIASLLSAEEQRAILTEMRARRA
ncbi:MAG: hemerythrin domain-containing protein [Myxococcota bacterium]|nr:hemerythrin domain-containing protein [Myxococcota bacterium]